MLQLDNNVDLKLPDTLLLRLSKMDFEKFTTVDDLSNFPFYQKNIPTIIQFQELNFNSINHNLPLECIVFANNVKKYYCAGVHLNKVILDNNIIYHDFPLLQNSLYEIEVFQKELNVNTLTNISYQCHVYPPPSLPSHQEIIKMIH